MRRFESCWDAHCNQRKYGAELTKQSLDEAVAHNAPTTQAG